MSPSPLILAAINKLDWPAKNLPIIRSHVEWPFPLLQASSPSGLSRATWESKQLHFPTEGSLSLQEETNKSPIKRRRRSLGPFSLAPLPKIGAKVAQEDVLQAWNSPKLGDVKKSSSTQETNLDSSLSLKLTESFSSSTMSKMKDLADNKEPFMWQALTGNGFFRSSFNRILECVPTKYVYVMLSCG